jgi:hypothetical protein
MNGTLSYFYSVHRLDELHAHQAPKFLRGDSATGTSVPIPLNRKLVNGFVRKQREPGLQDIYP